MIAARLRVAAASVLLCALAALALAACSDVPPPTANESQAESVADAAPAPKATKGVVPDLFEVTLEDSRKALSEAGFEVKAEAASLFGTASDELLVCEQKPEPGAKPAAGSTVRVVVDRDC